MCGGSNGERKTWARQFGMCVPSAPPCWPGSAAEAGAVDCGASRASCGTAGLGCEPGPCMVTQLEAGTLGRLMHAQLCCGTAGAVAEPCVPPPSAARLALRPGLSQQGRASNGVAHRSHLTVLQFICSLGWSRLVGWRHRCFPGLRCSSAGQQLPRTRCRQAAKLRLASSSVQLSVAPDWVPGSDRQLGRRVHCNERGTPRMHVPDLAIPAAKPGQAY